MRIFLFSRRFLIPFFLILILHLVYFEWEAWQLYKDDLDKKGIPGSIKLEWMLRQAAGYVLSLSFLIAVLSGAVLYGHQYLKRNNDHRKIFSPANILAIMIVSLVGFYYVSFLQPGNSTKARMLLADIVFARPEEPFERTTMELRKNWEQFTLPELYKARDSVQHVLLNPNSNLMDQLNTTKREYQRYDYLINNKIAYAFTIIVFYFFGILLGISFRKTVAAVPLLIGYFLLFPVWAYSEAILEELHARDKINAFLAGFGITILLALIGAGLFLLLRKYKFYKAREEELSLDFTPEP
jgi:hypothetical protein